jgi:hypothetical protein
MAFSLLLCAVENRVINIFCGFASFAGPAGLAAPVFCWPGVQCGVLNVLFVRESGGHMKWMVGHA